MNTPAFQLWPTMRRVERVAWNALVRCMKAKKLKAIPLPVPVEEWIEGPLGIQFSISDLSHLGLNALGAARPRDREIQVSQTLVGQDARFRFTAAHELGHVLLHEKIASDFRDLQDADYFERRIEREADRFAAAFLMPIPSLCAEFAAAAQNLWSDPQSLLSAVARGDPPAQNTLRSIVLPHLTERFGVSLTAALRRFSDVQLPSGEPALTFETGLAFLAREDIGEAVRRK